MIPRVIPIRAHVKIRGMKAEIDGDVLVDAGTTFTLVDEELARSIGVTTTSERVKLYTFCCEVEGVIANVEYMKIEERGIGATSILMTRFPSKLRSILSRYGVRNDLILGLSDLIKSGYVIDLKEGKLKYAGVLFIPLLPT